MSDERRTVYSTDGSLPLPTFARKAKGPAKQRSAPPDDGILRVGCENRRGGKVTLVYGLAPAELEAAGKELRRRCGTGGTAKAGILELQGDRRDVVIAYLAESGRRARRMGGA